MQSTTATITPELAKSWLDLPSERQRKIQPSAVQKIAELMLAGRWAGHPAPYMLDTEGHLIDGQHRANAIVEAGVTIEGAILIYDVDPEMFDRIDIGTRRNASQFIHAPNASIMAQAARMVLSYREDPEVQNMVASTQAWTFADVLAEVSSNSLLPALALPAAAAYRGSHINGATLLAVASIGGETNGDRLEEWFYGLQTGEDLGRGDPRLALRKKWEGNFRRLNLTSANRLRWGLIVKAWNAWVSEEPMVALNYRALRTSVREPEQMPRIL